MLSVHNHHCRGAWVAQLVKCLTLDLSSDLDIMVVSLSPALGSALDMETKQNNNNNNNKKERLEANPRNV